MKKHVILGLSLLIITMAHCDAGSGNSDSNLELTDVDAGGIYALMLSENKSTEKYRIDVFDIKSKTIDKRQHILKFNKKAVSSYVLWWVSITPHGVWLYFLDPVKREKRNTTMFFTNIKTGSTSEIELPEWAIGDFDHEYPSGYTSECTCKNCGFIKSLEYPNQKRFLSGDRFLLLGNVVIDIKSGSTYSLETGKEIKISEAEPVKHYLPHHNSPRNFALVVRNNEEDKYTTTLTDLRGEKPVPVADEQIKQVLDSSVGAVFGYNTLLIIKRNIEVCLINLKNMKPITTIIGDEKIKKNLMGVKSLLLSPDNKFLLVKGEEKNSLIEIIWNKNSSFKLVLIEDNKFNEALNNFSNDEIFFEFHKNYLHAHDFSSCVALRSFPVRFSLIDLQTKEAITDSLHGNMTTIWRLQIIDGDRIFVCLSNKTYNKLSILLKKDTDGNFKKYKVVSIKDNLVKICDARPSLSHFYMFFKNFGYYPVKC
jgi:hypothetical protein